MPWARSALRLDEKLAIGANGLEAVMFDDDEPSCQQTQDHGREGGASDVDDIGRANEPPKAKKTWLPDNGKGKRAVVVITGWSLRHQSDFELEGSFGVAQLGKAASQRKNDGFHAADARRKKMAVNQQRQGRNFWWELGGAFLRRRI
jgi:hypothetical protein